MSRATPMRPRDRGNKLVLRRERLRQLTGVSDDALRAVAGGTATAGQTTDGRIGSRACANG